MAPKAVTRKKKRKRKKDNLDGSKSKNFCSANDIDMEVKRGTDVINMMT